MSLEGKLDPTLWERIDKPWEDENYTNAIRDAMQFLTDLIRERSGLDGDGASLVGRAFGGDAPVIKVNRMRTQSEMDEQKGIEQLLRGLFQGIRNPRTHDDLNDDEEDAEAIIVFINYLAGIIDRSRSPFSMGRFLEKVRDPGFVPAERYADLLVEKIPEHRRLEAFLGVYDLGTGVAEKNFRYVFDALLPLLNDEEKQHVIDEISERLNETNDDRDIRIAIRSFEPGIWATLAEEARLRAENTILQSIVDGRYDIETGMSIGGSGSLGTWLSRIWTVCEIRDRVYRVALGKLDSKEDEEKDYVFQYFFRLFPTIEEEPGRLARRVISKGLREGERRFLEALEGLEYTYPAWPEAFSKEIQEFEEKVVTFLSGSDDVPF